MASESSQRSPRASEGLADALRVLADEANLGIVFRLHVGQCPLGVLAGALALPEDRVAERVAGLVAAGVVRASPDPDDPAVTLYSLDPGGLGALNRAWTSVVHLPSTSPGGDRSVLAARMATLRRHPLFAALDDPDLMALAVRLHARSYGPGEIVFLEGQPCRGLYLVETGIVRISKQDTGGAGGGRAQTLRMMGAGDSFGEVPVFDGGPNPATAEAVEASRLLLLPVDAIRQMLRVNPTFAETVVGVFAGRLRHMVALVEDLSFRNVAGRVAKVLLQTIQPEVGVGAGSTARARLTQQEIAEMAGTAREVVARCLREFERRGAISVDRGRITILDPARLESLD